jgi:Spy/CpxP family protein refolding chaperone
MTQGLESLGRIRLQGIALLLVAFVAGGLTGAAIEHRRSAPPPPMGPPGPLEPGRLPPGLERLDLTTEQRSRIMAILDQARPRTDSIFREAMPRVRAVMDGVRDSIRTVLTEEQRKEFDEVTRNRPVGGPGGGPGGPEMGPPPGGRPEMGPPT